MLQTVEDWLGRFDGLFRRSEELPLEVTVVASRRQCAGTNARGEPCQSPMAGEDGFCPAHRPGGETEMRRRALRGAIASRRARGLAPGELGALESHSDAKRWLRLIGEAVVTGRLSNRDAQAGVKAVEAWLKAHGEGVVAKDVAELREALDAFRKRGKLKAMP